MRERCADFTARRIASALAVADGAARPAYVESGGDLVRRARPRLDRVTLGEGRSVLANGAVTREDRAMTYVYDFSDGNKDQKDLLGGKGANLAEMTNLGLPVPPGFTISTEACRAYLEAGDVPDGLDGEIDERLRALEEAMGRRLGDPADPLLVSVRSGAKFSMPGMMETVLNVGLNDESVRGLAAQSDDERFAMDSYRRLLQMFGATVLGIESEVFARALDKLKKDRGTESDTDLGVDDLRELVETFKRAISEHTGRDFPQDPREQLDLAMRAVFDSWNTERAVLYRRQERIEEGLGTAVNVQAMVFGNRGDDSGLRGRLHPRPRLGQPGRVRRLPPERPGRGRRRGHPQHGLAGRHGEDRQDVARRAARRSCRPSRSTTATCATSSSPSSAASSGCSRPGSASAPPRRRSGSVAT